MPQTETVSAIIVAGGMGTRMNAPLPKQFLALKGKPVVQWSLECFDQLPFVDEIILVLPETWLDEGRDKLISFDPRKPFKIVSGGQRRQDSVKAGLDSVQNNDGWVIIHDGARPGITIELVSKAFEKARNLGNAVCAIPSNDTLVKVIEGKIVSSVNRKEIYRIQTPQIFRTGKMRKALENAIANNITATDDAGLIRKLGDEINLVEGCELNSKVTRAEDLEILETLL
jgi:2-C-methyl-D-erythritol 4-phosphate cytidylyltransferase